MKSEDLESDGTQPPGAKFCEYQTRCSDRSRIVELADILAAGLMRLQARKSSQLCADSGESSLDISPTESGHPTRFERENCG